MIKRIGPHPGHIGMTRQDWQWRTAMLRRRGGLGSGRPRLRPASEGRARRIPAFVSELWAWLRGDRKERP